ncbi:MAG TPA: DUF3105 domain-containing protein, partial [Actinomycetota bacterium]|nr:DUF3105 domain-containing protein [Actinomycetota bacterium]
VDFLIMNERSEEGSESAGVSRSAAGCDEVETHEEGERDHVEEGSRIEYTESPPTSGPHYAQQSQPGFFSAPVEPERMVHNLEHGQIVVWYSPDAPQATIDAIESAVDEDPVSLLAAPYGDMPSGSDVVFTAWAASQSCADFSSQVFNDFRERFQGRGPEPVGIPTFDGA